MRDFKQYEIFNTFTPKAITSSTDATPIVVTATSHGFSNGDLVLIHGHTTNIAANGIYKVANKTANTFELTDRYTGSNIAGSGGGAGASGIIVPAKVVDVSDFRHVEIQVATSGTATLTFKVAGSLGKVLNDESAGHGDTPNFGATQGDNAGFYQFMNLVDLLDGSSISGSTGIAVAGTDINKAYEINTNGIKYICFVPTAFTQGAVTIKVVGFTNA